VIIRTTLVAVALLTASGSAATRSLETLGNYVDDVSITTAVKGRFIDNKDVATDPVLQIGPGAGKPAVAWGINLDKAPNDATFRPANFVISSTDALGAVGYGIASPVAEYERDKPLVIWSPSAAVAEPSSDTYAMLLAGLGLIGFVAYRRTNSAAD
jgi:hypothetical protein